MKGFVSAKEAVPSPPAGNLTPAYSTDGRMTMRSGERERPPIQLVVLPSLAAYNPPQAGAEVISKEGRAGGRAGKARREVLYFDRVTPAGVTGTKHRPSVPGRIDRGPASSP